ncbi:hypothetical protein HD554DRAFT_1077280 [Boletus coccyginus]|nr:hypothetical protein HD554DRAFT_1077280 [Boletus coccyginus]
MSRPIIPCCIICTLFRLHRSQQINPGQQHPLPSELATELEDSRKILLNSLMTLLAVLAILGSKSVLPVMLALLVYTIGLHLTADTCSLQNYPALSRLLHAIPLLGNFLIAGVELVLYVQPPTLAAVVLLLSLLPLIAAIVHHGSLRWSVGPAIAELPIGVRDPPATRSSFANMMVVSNSTNSVPVEAGRHIIC